MMTNLPNKLQITYGSCRLGTTILLNIITLATFWIYTNYYDLAPILNGIGNAIAKIMIALSSFLFGYISDRLPQSKLGRRKIFIIIGSPLLAFSFVMLFLPQFFIGQSDTIIIFFWLVIWNSSFHMFYGFVLTPYQSWLPEIADENDRVEVSAYQNIANTIGSIIGGGFSFFIAGYLQKSGGIDSRAGLILTASVIIFAILEVLMFLPTILFIKEERKESIGRKLRQELRVLFENKNYIKWLFARGIYSIGMIISTTLLLDFAQHILGLNSPIEFLITGSLSLGTMLLGFGLWTLIAQKSGKKKALIAGNIWLILFSPWSIVIGKISFIPGNIQGYLYCALLGFGTAPLFLYPYAVIADISHKDQEITKNNRAGTYTGFQAIPNNIFQAIGLIIAGFLRDIRNYQGLYWLGPITAFFLVAAIPILSKTDLDPLDDKKN